MKTGIGFGMLIVTAWLIVGPGAGAWVYRKSSPFREPQLVLHRVGEVMKEHRRLHGEYPSEWRQLSVSCHGWPRQQDRERWQPRNCEAVYRIVQADRDHFSIQALGWEDRPTYELREGMEWPRELPGAKDALPRLATDTPEPKQFLPIAAAAMRDARRRGATRYPDRWQDLQITFSAIPSKTYSRNIRPDGVDAREWRPRGCDYVYSILEADADHFVIGASGRMSTIEYEIRDGMTEAKFLRDPPANVRIVE